MIAWSQKTIMRLLGVAACTAVVIGLYWLLIIRTEQGWLDKLQQEVTAKQKEMENTTWLVGKWEEFKTDWTRSDAELTRLESSLASGDAYRWMVRTFDNLASTDIELKRIDPPRPADPGLPAGVPYDAALFVIHGNATYHEFGKFLSSMENRFIHMSVRSLELEPAAPDLLDGDGAEKLFFRLEILTLAKRPTPEGEAPALQRSGRP